jgi:hypothetical protein
MPIILARLTPDCAKQAFVTCIDKLLEALAGGCRIVINAFDSRDGSYRIRWGAY